MVENIILKVEMNQYVNYALCHNYIPFIQRIIIENNTMNCLKGCRLFINVDSEICENKYFDVPDIKENSFYELQHIHMNISFDKLYSLTERIISHISIQLLDNNEILKEYIQDLNFLACDEWIGSTIMPELLCTFITPNNPKITEILIDASQELRKVNNDNSSFTGYQTEDPNEVIKQIQSIYTALWKKHIIYNNPPASYETIGQRIRLPQNVLSQKMGTCLDLSVLFASCLEAIGLFPLVIIKKGHAFIGCWLKEETFVECINDDVSSISKRAAEGIYDIVLMETTCITKEKFISFREMLQIGNNNLDDDFEICIDVKRCRGSGIRSLPEKVEQLSNIHLAEREKESGHEIVELQFSPKLKDVESIQVSRLQTWERKLLDLSLRNQLINLRITQNIVQLMITQLDMLEDELSSGKEFQILGKPSDFENSLIDKRIYSIEQNEDIIEILMKTEFKSKRIRTFLDEDNIKYALTSLYRNSRVSLEENGANTLYLALGFLKWYENDITQKARYAPLILIPIEIIRKSAKVGFVIRERDEDVQFNITLLEKLKQDFGIEICGLDPLPEDNHGVDINIVFNVVRQAVLNKKRWDVIELAFIGLFSFKQFVMWNDIKNRSDELQRNKVVQSLINNKLMWKPNYPNDTDDYDQQFSPIDLALPISVDSSQLAAIALSNGEGESFVLHGPPGTGKSQTITNIIANALYHDKTVLFIAEKSAALSVVQKRLESIGLGPFCLELHSNKARKKDVLQQLDKTLELSNLKHPEDYLETANEILELRKQLNELMNKIHKKTVFGLSLYDYLVKVDKLNEIDNIIIYNIHDLDNLNEEIIKNKYRTIDNFILSAKNVIASENELLPLTFTQYSLEIKDNILSFAHQIRDDYDKLSQENIYKIISNKGFVQTEDIDLLVKVLEWYRNSKKYLTQELLDLDNMYVYQDGIRNLIQLGLAKNEVEKYLNDYFDLEYIEVPYQELYTEWKSSESTWLIPKLIKQNNLLKRIKILSKNPNQINKNIVIDLLEKFNQKDKINLQIQSSNKELLEIFNQYIKTNNFDKIEVINNSIMNLYKLINTSKIKDTYLMVLNELLLEDCENFIYIDLLKEILKKYKNMSLFCTWKKTGNWFMVINDFVNTIMKNSLGLREWNIYSKARSEMHNQSLSVLVDKYENKIYSLDQLKDIFDKSLSLLIVEYLIDSYQEINNFTSEWISDRLNLYRDSTKKFERLTQEEIVARLSSKIPNITSVSSSSEIGILKRAIKSNGRGLSIRKLFELVPHLLTRLSPCMLMSPMSVAQYIDPSYPKFDLIVFDEASQLPTSEAVGAIARGKNVIVVGDPNQLPPTSFFASSNVDDENFESEDLQSVLDDCLTLSMPQMHLLWHYRSQHESLISFSNREFYDNKLLTFPSVNDMLSKVNFVHVNNGYYEKGNRRVNVEEAKSIVEDIKRRLTDPKLSQQSIGVVTFNASQQNLIDDMLIKAFQEDKALEEKANHLHESIFIKNLENVQGDERDVILFSICYGPDQNGKVSMNFGPLNKDGGERRLNVAVSRARSEMIVFSTLLPQQIDLSRTRARGVVALKSFLEYAQQGKNKITENVQQVSLDEFVPLVAKEIEKLGYKVNMFVGSSMFKVDIGVLDPKNEHSYLLGIMLDGIQYKQSKTSRDRNISQLNVLKGLGWNIYQLWVMDWYEHKEKQLEIIKQLLKESSIYHSSQKNTVESLTYLVEPSSFIYKKNDIVQRDKLIEYKISELEFHYGGADKAAEPFSKDILIDMMNKVILDEAPISQEVLFKRVMQAWGVSRIGARLQKALNDASKKVDSPFKGRVKLTKKKFYWGNIDPQKYNEFRGFSDNYRRGLDDICYEEIKNAGIYVLRQQLSLNEDDFIKSIINLFGYTKCSASMKSIMKGAIKYMQNIEVIKIENDKIFLNE